MLLPFLAVIAQTTSREEVALKGNSWNCYQKRVWMNAPKAKTINVHYTSSPSSNQQTTGGEQPISSWTKPAGIHNFSLVSVLSPQEKFQRTVLLPDQHCKQGWRSPGQSVLIFSRLYLWGSLRKSMPWPARVCIKPFQNVGRGSLLA